mgnify:CR=1 FL=1
MSCHTLLCCTLFCYDMSEAVVESIWYRLTSIHGFCTIPRDTKVNINIVAKLVSQTKEIIKTLLIRVHQHDRYDNKWKTAVRPEIRSVSWMNIVLMKENISSILYGGQKDQLYKYMTYTYQLRHHYVRFVYWTSTLKHTKSNASIWICWTPHCKCNVIKEETMMGVKEGRETGLNVQSTLSGTKLTLWRIFKVIRLDYYLNWFNQAYMGFAKNKIDLLMNEET